MHIIPLKLPKLKKEKALPSVQTLQTKFNMSYHDAQNVYHQLCKQKNLTTSAPTDTIKL